jgi:hypothetical protein
MEKVIDCLDSDTTANPSSLNTLNTAARTALEEVVRIRVDAKSLDRPPLTPIDCPHPATNKAIPPSIHNLRFMSVDCHARIARPA